jgi:hypothetical protein
MQDSHSERAATEARRRNPVAIAGAVRLSSINLN